MVKRSTIKVKHLLILTNFFIEIIRNSVIAEFQRPNAGQNLHSLDKFLHARPRKAFVLESGEVDLLNHLMRH